MRILPDRDGYGLPPAQNYAKACNHGPRHAPPRAFDGVCHAGRMDHERVRLAKESPKLATTTVVDASNKRHPLPEVPEGLYDDFIKVLEGATSNGVVIAHKLGLAPIDQASVLQRLLDAGLIERCTYGGAPRLRIPRVNALRNEYLPK